MDESLTTVSTQGSSTDDIVSRLEAKLNPSESSLEQVPPQESTDESVQTSDTNETQGDDEEQEVAEEVTIESAHLAHVLGVDESNIIVDDDGKLFLQTKVDGEIGKVALNDLLKSYQTEAHVTRKSQALAEERKAFEESKAAGLTVIQQQIGEVAAVSQLLEQQLTSQYNSIDWNSLRAQNPSEWVALRQEFTDRVNQINGMKARANQVLQEQIKNQELRSLDAKKNIILREAEALRVAIPDWNDPEVAMKEHAAMAKFVSDIYGIAPADLDEVVDHRHILILRDAMKYREGLAQQTATKKKIASLPRIVKPGSKSTNGAAQRTAEQEKIVRLKKTGHIKDLEAVLASRLS